MENEERQRKNKHRDMKTKKNAKLEKTCEKNLSKIRVNVGVWRHVGMHGAEPGLREGHGSDV